MKIFSSAILVLMLNTSWAASRAVPLMDLRDIIEQELPPSMITSDCSSNGGCWGWLPIQDVQENDVIVPDDIARSRLHTRQIPNLDTNIALQQWQENMSPLKKPVSASSISQIGNRISKKDVFVSRSWGAGGMPFSVLYMSPHTTRTNHAATTTQQGLEKSMETSTSSLTHPNYRIALRNGATGQPRRQYSIIPQLFISYGWAPFGK